MQTRTPWTKTELEHFEKQKKGWQWFKATVTAPAIPPNATYAERFGMRTERNEVYLRP